MPPQRPLLAPIFARGDMRRLKASKALNFAYHEKVAFIFFLFFTYKSLLAQNILYDSVKVEKLILAEKDSVESILSAIKCGRIIQTGYRNKASSYIDLETSSNYGGINYIYLFDLVLDSEMPPIDNPTVSINSMRGKFQKYSNCVIVKKNNTSYRRLTCHEVQFLHETLVEWWIKHKGEDFELIKTKWKEDNVLTKRGFIWK